VLWVLPPNLLVPLHDLRRLSSPLLDTPPPKIARRHPDELETPKMGLLNNTVCGVRPRQLRQSCCLYDGMTGRRRPPSAVWSEPTTNHSIPGHRPLYHKRAIDVPRGPFVGHEGASPFRPQRRTNSKPKPESLDQRERLLCHRTTPRGCVCPGSRPNAVSPRGNPVPWDLIRAWLHRLGMEQSNPRNCCPKSKAWTLDSRRRFYSRA